MSTVETSFESLWSELRLQELANEAADPARTLPAKMAAALGAVRRRSALDTAVNIAELNDDATWGPVAHLVALRGFQRLGAMRHAERHASALEKDFALHPFAKVARAELAGEQGRCFSVPGVLAEHALWRGDGEHAAQVLVGGLRDSPRDTLPLVWYEGAPLLAGLALAQGRTAEILELCEGFLQRYAKSELAAGWHIVSINTALYGGDSEPVRRLAQDEAAPAPAREFATRLVQRLDLAMEPQRWVRAHSPLAVAAAVYPELEGREVLRRLLADRQLSSAPQSLAGIRAVLRDRDCAAVRCRLSEPRLAELLEADAQVIVAEERPVGTGFVRIAGFERASGLLLVERFDHVGAGLRYWDDQQRRSALHGIGALVVMPRGNGALEALHEQSLDALDACEGDVRHAQAGRGRAAHLTAEAVERCKDVPRAWQLRGEALLELLRAGELEGSNADGPLEAWYAEARTRFETAEWAHQTYATCLDHWGLSHEAAIAWADARRLDDNDYRNALGLSQNRLLQGYARSAFTLADEAVARAPEKPAPWTQLALSALEVGSERHAQVAADAVLEVAPENAVALRVLGVSLERSGKLEEALAYHERGAADENDDGSAARRACLARMRLGDFERAREHALASMQRDPGEAQGYQLASLTFRARGNADDAISVLEFGISRVGPHSDLVEAYAAAVAELTDGAELDARVERALELWAENPDVLASFGDTFMEFAARERAERCFAAAIAAGADSLSPSWRRARAYLKARLLAEAEPLLAALVEQNPNAYFIAALDGVRRKLGSAPSLDLLRRASPDASPALVWGVTHGVAAACSNGTLASALEQRLFGLAPDALIDAAGFLVEHGLFEDATGLAELAEKHPRAEQTRAGRLRLRHSLERAAGEHAAAVARALELHEQNPEYPVINSEIAAALRTRSAEPLRRLSQKRLDYVLANASLEWGDASEERALLACAAYWQGDAGPLDALLSTYTGHPTVLRVVAEALSGSDDPRAAETLENLAQVAPGAARRLATQEGT
jgi:tetratricopeptide (TPR) repeat protein